MAEDEAGMAWEAQARLWRPGLRIDLELISKDVLDYIPFEYPTQTPRKSFWGQTVADVRINIRQGFQKTQFQAEGLLETMVTGRL